MLIIILFRLGSDRPSGLLFILCLLYFFPYSRLCSFLLLLFLCLISFLLFPCASVWENTRTVHEFPISYCHIEWYLFFSPQCNYKCSMCIRSEKLEIVNYALVNLNHKLKEVNCFKYLGAIG